MHVGRGWPTCAWAQKVLRARGAGRAYMHVVPEDPTCTWGQKVLHPRVARRSYMNVAREDPTCTWGQEVLHARGATRSHMHVVPEGPTYTSTRQDSWPGHTWGRWRGGGNGGEEMEAWEVERQGEMKRSKAHRAGQEGRTWISPFHQRKFFPFQC